MTSVIPIGTLPPVYIDKFQQHYIDRGFKVWIDKKPTHLILA